MNQNPTLGQYPQTAHNLVVSRFQVRQWIQQNWEIVGAMVPADWQTNSAYYRPANRPGLRDFNAWKKWMGGSGQWQNASFYKKNQQWSLLETMLVAAAMNTSGVDDVLNRTQVGDGALTQQFISDYQNLYQLFFGTPSNRTESSVRTRGMHLALIGKEEKASEMKEALEARLAEAEGELETEQNEKEELQNRVAANDARSEALRREVQDLRNQINQIKNLQVQAGAATAENAELRQQLNEVTEAKEDAQELAADLLVCHTQFLQRAAAQAKRTKGGQEVVEMARKKLRARGDNSIGSSAGHLQLM